MRPSNSVTIVDIVIGSTAILIACGCSGDEPEPLPTAPSEPSLAVTNLAAVDVGNTGSGSDILVSFGPATSRESISEYRIFVGVPTTSNLGVSAVLELPQGQYVTHTVSSDTARIVLSGLLDVEGAVITEGSPYFVFVLSVSSNVAVPGKITGPIEVQLENATTVYTFAPRVVGGTGGISIDDSGAVYVADFVNKVYRVSPDGSQTVFSSGHNVPSGNLVFPNGDLLQANFGDGTLDRITATGGSSVYARGLEGPVGMTMDAAGDVLVVNCNANTVSRVTSEGAVSTWSSSALLRCPNSITGDGSGMNYIVNFDNGAVLALDSAGAVTTLASIPGSGNGHIVSYGGALWVTAKAARQIYKVDLDGTVTLVAGTGVYGAQDGPALMATLARPNGIVVSPDGRFLYWNDHLGDAQNNYGAGPAVLRRMEFPRDD